MKHFSSNIKPIAGILAVKNLNVFPSSGAADCLDYTKPWVDSFREAVRRASVLAEMAFADHDDGYRGDQFTLLQLSVPRFEALGSDRYRLTGGMFLWAGYLFSPGATFRVQGNDFHIETPDLIEVATAVPATMQEMKYDTYNASHLSEISDDVLHELDIQLDKSALPGEIDNDDPDWLQEVKYVSIYAETLTGGEPGRVIAYPTTDMYGGEPDATPELGFEGGYVRDLLDSWKANYDQFLVEFVDTTQPFAYITVELIGRALCKQSPGADAAEGGDEFMLYDGFGALFDATSKEELAKHDAAEIVETLHKIAAGEL